MTPHQYWIMFRPWRPWSDVFRSFEKLRIEAQAAGLKDLAHWYAWQMVRMKDRIEAEARIRRGLGS